MLKPITAREIEEELIKIKQIMDKKFEGFIRGSQAKLQVEKSEFLLPLLLDSFQQGKMEEQTLIDNGVACGLLKNSKTNLINNR